MGQKGWKTGKGGSAKPVSTTKKTISTTKNAYTFMFKNGCVVTVVFDTSNYSAKRASSKCSTDKCVDNVSMLKSFVIQFELPEASNCAFIYKLIDEEFGFSCKQSLKSLVGKDISLSDVCCKTCMKMKKPKKTTPKPKACGSPKYKGDGNCDDNNNHKGCGYDGGDCCVASVKGGQVKKDFCKACKCIDPKNKGKKPSKPTCGRPSYKGGDCCGAQVNKKYCKVCKCIDPKNQGGKPTCGSPNYKGDGVCDDNNNNKGCGYDGGDCCGAQVNKKYCKVCKCIDPKNQGGK